MSNKIKIGNRAVGEGESVYIIAELSANHLHNLDYALELVRESARIGVDAFKIQTLTPDTMTIDCNNEWFTINSGSPWDGRILYDLYSETPLPYEWHKPIFDLCNELGLDVFSTPYDKTALEFLDQFNPIAYKVASFEIRDIPLIKEIAKKQKPIIFSTGIATYEDIKLAVEVCREVGNNQLVVLKTTSAYPAPFEEINLLTLPHLMKEFDVIGGVSDHTLGMEVAIASVALGGKVIEKHITLDRNLGGPDAKFSLNVKEFEQLVKSVRNTEKLLGTVNYEPTEKAIKNNVFARSLFIVEDVAKGEVFTEKNIRSIRPGYGLHPKYYWDVLGKKATQNYEKGTPLTFDCIEGGYDLENN